MHFSEIPGEVIFNHLFPFLNINDLLRLRRVSKFLKPLVQDYIRLHANSATYITISGDDGNLSEFLSMKLTAPTSRFHISNKNNKSFESESLLNFLQLYGSKITHLRIHSMEIPMVSRKAIHFFESLPNLEYLAITEVHERGCHGRRGKRRSFEQNSQQLSSLLPSSFKRLRTLMVGQYFCSPNLDSVQLIWRFFQECSKHLEVVNYPDIVCKNAVDLADLPAGKLGDIRKIVTGGNLKYAHLGELVEVRGHHRTAQEFNRLVTTCFQHNVKLVDVDANLVEGALELDPGNGDKLAKVIVSLSYLHRSSFMLELPNLEKIVIGEEDGTAFQCSMPHWDFPRPKWSNLKELDILVESESLWAAPGEAVVATSALLDYFFVGVTREKMETLKLTFFKHFYKQSGRLPYPGIKHLCSACPNLRKLTIGYWPGGNRVLSRLWGDLPLLEHVTFDSCEKLGDAAFVGKDKEKPALLKAKNLRRLELASLDRMPKITDKLFKYVLRHMPLKELHLSSGVTSPIKTITLSGLRSLQTGIFAENIEKFSLEHIRLENVTPEELETLEDEFRSSRMM